MTLRSTTIPRGKIVFSAIAVVTLLVLFLLLSISMGKDKFSLPSQSARSAKWRGVFLNEVELTAIQQSQKNSFVPKEAWVESVVENYEGFALVRKGIVGKRLCVRVEYSTAGPYREDTSLSDVEMTLNGERPKPKGGLSDSTGTTFVFPLAAQDEFPNDGEVAFSFEVEEIEFRFRYKTK